MGVLLYCVDASCIFSKSPFQVQFMVSNQTEPKTKWNATRNFGWTRMGNKVCFFLQI